MKVQKQLFSLLTFLIVSFFAYSQQVGKFKFIDKNHDFGTIEEDGGPALHTFQFVNVGDAPIHIKNVKASCGCTTPSWSKEEIMPGDTGFVKAKYDPMNRPGAFHKQLTINSNAENKTESITIKGNVKPRVKKPEELYRYKIGGTLFDKDYFSFDNVFTNDKKTVKIPVYNNSKMSIKFEKEKFVLPKYINVYFDFEELEPKKLGNITFEFVPNLTTDWGLMESELTLITNEEKEMEKKFKFYATKKEFFPEYSADELKVKPRIKLSDTTFNLGTIYTNTETKKIITLTNEGKEDLIIRKVVSSCGCLVYKSKKNIVKSGKSTKLYVTYNPGDKQGLQNEMITIISNAPKKPEAKIGIRAISKKSTK